MVEDHAVDSGVVLVRIVLHILLQSTSSVDRKDVSISGKVVEWVAVHIIRWLIGGEHEDCTSFGISIVRFGMATHRV